MEPLILNKLKELSRLRQEFRLELAGEINGVQYINDSASNTIKATVQSINAIQSDLLLIIGGNDSITDYEFLFNAELTKVKGIIYLGHESKKLMNVVLKHTHFFANATSLKEAVQIAKAYATQKQTVLYSPAANFVIGESCGDTFKELVNTLK